ncbi:Spermidine synthase [Frankliniella fusca]|uniref:Spermidine synthase n=1 Tax=Frankliniella fusca TaxID=407009 RepID=A0AAE1LXZ1_9NEOP|nr:Spermidine synthase [Frankliniella fusca]
MDLLKQGWFSELNDLWPGMSLSLEVQEVLHKEKSQFQDIMVLQTKSHGKALILDGIIQCTESDEFAYQEMISFLPLCCHPSPKRVLIVGGGDGGVAREVAKHPDVEKIDQVEIDERVIEVSKKYLPSMAVGFSHPKLSLHVEDGFKFMQQHEQAFDVVITDSSDPVGPAVSLFQESYFSLMKRALKPGGIVCSQGGTTWANPEHVAQTLSHCKATFPAAAYGFASVPTYPTGQIGFVIGSLNEETNFKEPVRIFSEEELESMQMRYYNADIHRAAFILPRFAQKILSSETHISDRNNNPGDVA